MNDIRKSLHDESDEALDRAIRAATEQPSPSDVKNRIIETAAAWQRKPHVGVDYHLLERLRTMILAHKRLSLAAAAAVTALAASLILYISLFSFLTPAYALEQTIEANSHITSYHVKIAPPSSAMGVGEAWVELAPGGAPLRGRMDIFGGDRGDRVGIVSRNRGEFWWKAKNTRVVSDNKWVIEKALEQCTKMRALFDPKLAFEQLRADEEAGKVQVAMQRPARDGEPITLTVTSKGDPNRRFVYEVDPGTKLVERVFEYRGRGEQWKQALEIDVLDYNKEIDPKVFQPDLPSDITTIDPSKMDFSRFGLAEGDLTDREIAAKVAGELFEALVGGTYQRLGQLNDVRSATWRTTTVVRGPGRETETSTGIGMFLTPSRERAEKTTGGRTEIELADGQKDYSVSLVPAARMALVRRFKNLPPAGPLGKTFLNLRKRIADARSGAGEQVEWLGIETIDGRRAEGFRVRHGKIDSGYCSDVILWSDPKNSLPIRVESVSLAGGDETRTVITDFHTNVDLDDSLFSLDVPAGYAMQTMPVDLSKQPIDYLVDALKFAAEHNGDLFPATLLGEQGLPGILRRAVESLENKYGKDSPEMFKLRSEIRTNREAAIVFLSNLSPANDWHYAGKGVKLYTPDKPIFWCKPAGADKYRVVFADLKIKELALESFEFPLGPPSKPLGDDQFEVTFSYRPSKKAQSVYLAGSFNDWNPMALRMDGPDRDGRFSARLKLKKGTYEYKFVLDGRTWETDPNNIWQRGINGNSEMHVGLPLGSAAKPLGDDQFEVAFSYRPSKEVKSVYLAGSFNDWKPTAHKMDGPDHEGRFSTRLKLKKGTYEYKFVLDGQTWETDPDNVWRTGFYQNSLLYIGVR
jgi:hypothetical protein